MVPQPVFLSYARKTSRVEVQALRDALGATTCFLDAHDLDLASQFPRELTEALLGATVFVAFVDATYFQRWYCLRERQLARAPFDEWLRRGADQATLTAAVDHIVVALAPGADDHALEHLPPQLRNFNWPTSDATHALAELIRSMLSSPASTLAVRCDAAGVPPARRHAMIDEAALLLPKNLAGVPMYPKTMPPSLGSGFVGRVDDMWRLHVALSEPQLDSPHLAAVSGALQGGGGFGKTQLAREYVHRFGPTFHAGGCFWVDAGGGEPIERQLHGVLRALRLNLPSIEEMRAAGRDVRAELIDVLHVEAVSKSILFVVDNVPEPDAGQAPLPLETWCPALGKITCLATSRKRLGDVGAIQSIDVDVLAPPPSVALLATDVPGRKHLRDLEWGEIC